MEIPKDLHIKMAEKTGEELLAIVARPDDWLPQAIDAANAELQKRGLQAPTSAIQESPLVESGTEQDLEETTDFKRLTTIGIGGGVVLQVFGRALGEFRDLDSIYLSVMGQFAGVVLFVWGCKIYAIGKGYSKWLGGLGLLSCLGLLVLMALPDRRKEFDDHTS